MEKEEGPPFFLEPGIFYNRKEQIPLSSQRFGNSINTVKSYGTHTFGVQ